MTSLECRSIPKYLALLAVLLAGCGGGNGDPTATVPPGTLTPGPATATPGITTPTRTNPPGSATPTNRPVTASVSGLVIVRSELAAASEGDLGTPPAFWEGTVPAAAGDKALSYAAWQLEGSAGLTGVTGADGTLDLGELPAGAYRLSLSKAINGNLVATTVDLTVGDQGGQFLIELEQGRVRTTVSYRDQGSEVREVSGPDGSHVIVRGDRAVAIGDASRELTDPDGDGNYLPSSCAGNVWRCDDANDCGGDGLLCQCSSSCPGCEDCGQHVCAPRAPVAPYRCTDDGSCQLPGDRCVCVSSCPECDDCGPSVCVPSCAPVTIVKLTIEGVTQVVLGRVIGLRAIATLDDGSSLDVTYLVAWSSSDATIATVDAWGTITAEKLGETTITAAVGELDSEPFELTVVERPSLARLEVQIAPCYYPWDRLAPGGAVYDASLPADVFPHPFCNDTVRVGQAVPLLAWAFYADGQAEEVTRLVSWQLDPNGIGEVTDGTFTGGAEGQVAISATLAGVHSQPVSLRVVTHPTIVQLSIYPTQGPLPPTLFPIFADDPRPSDASVPCFECGYGLTVLLGDQVPFVATARYDTGEWEDVSSKVTWRSSTASIAMLDEAGVLSALAAGDSSIDATYQGQLSNPVEVHVVAQATLLDLYVYLDGNDRVVEKGGEVYFSANGNYDVGFARTVTAQAEWRSSDESVGGFAQPGVFTGRSAGQVEVWAELDGKQSNRLPMSVFERSDIHYCDPDHINRAVWSDAFNRVTLESDCGEYTPPAVVELRFTVSERERPVGIFDPCLDLYVYQQGRKLRTIREQGCGEPFLAPGAPEFDDAAVRFQHKAFWDLRDDQGQLVAPGQYTIFGRFYLYYDPVVSIAVTVAGEGGRIPCVQNDCGNGCGYLHRCGDVEIPVACPAVCRPLCECPSGWGLTDGGDCEACGLECCPVGAVCAPELPPCSVVCCPPNARCLPGTPPCPSDGCCPAGAQCAAGIVPCEPKCCPPGALCGPLDLLSCVPDCCPTGAFCLPEIPPCDATTPCCVPGDVCSDNSPACG